MLIIAEFESCRTKLNISSTNQLLETLVNKFNLGDFENYTLQEYDAEYELYFDVDDISSISDRARVAIVLKPNTLLSSTRNSQNVDSEDITDVIHQESLKGFHDEKLY